MGGSLLMEKPHIRSTLKPKVRKKGNTNRTKGHNYERLLSNEFKDIGYENCTTSRYSSRLLDDCKVDLNIPDFNIQAKNVRSGLIYGTIFDDITEALKVKMPERLNYITAIFHKKKSDEFVVLKKEDFYILAKIYKNMIQK
jgi:hypothetical protein